MSFNKCKKKHDEKRTHIFQIHASFIIFFLFFPSFQYMFLPFWCSFLVFFSSSGKNTYLESNPKTRERIEQKHELNVTALFGWYYIDTCFLAMLNVPV